MVPFRHMNPAEISDSRLISQQIKGSRFKTVKEIVGWMGGMQAQDYAMAKWAVGLRLPDSTEQFIETAVNNGEIIRTHVLRPTWHFVSADDVHWMLELSANQIRASQKSRHKQLGLSESTLKKSNKIIENALIGGKYLTREELLVELGKAGINLAENRASHLLVWAELEGIVCSGGTKQGKQTYAILDERVPKKKSWNKEEALAELAGKYFSSHGPATIKDFVWWSGLSVNHAKRALDQVAPDLISETIDSQTYWFTEFHSISRIDHEEVFLLPAYDEFIISYENRSASLPMKDHKKTVSTNGIFRPVIILNGQVKGIWKRTINKEKVLIETELFMRPDRTTKGLIEKAALHYGDFLGKKTEINFE
jgi:hypothetical protein